MAKNIARLTAATIALLLAPASVEANPLGGTVVGGSATISQPAPNNVTVNQQSNRAIINWQSFSIGASESVRFQQPSSSSVVLNRVIGGDPSTIAGQLSANGMVFLVNPNGVVFTSSARIDVNGLIATTHDIPNADFMAGRFNFTLRGKPAAGIVNQGTITAAEGGLVGLVAPWVRNDGVIAARLGKVTLASGSAFALDLYGDQLIQFAVPATAVAQAPPSGALITNTGTINADGGTVWIGADTARQVVDQAINTTGIIEARAVKQQSGEIVLDGGAGGSVAVAGALDASGVGSGQVGGTVKVLGARVALNNGANVNVAGDSGGGTALVGGNFHGAGPERNARTTSIAPGASIDADAVTRGNGGQVAVWSDQTTSFQGMISARGGAQSGDGGYVEVSGHKLLNFLGTVNLTAPRGNWGTLLLDPENVTIEGSSSTTTTDTSANGNGTTLTGNVDNSVINTNDLQSALNLGNVTIVTGTGGNQNGDITVAAPISWGSSNTLTLSAYRNVSVNADINGLGDVNLRADNTGTGVGTVTFGNNARLDSAGTVSIYFNPSVNPAGSGVNSTSYVNPTENFQNNVLSFAVLRAYMLVNTIYDLQNVQNNLQVVPYALGRDIDASITATWNNGAGFTPIGTATIVFNGEGHTIDKLTIVSSQQSVGLFSSFNGNIFDPGGISNLGLTNVNITATASSTVGALVGKNLGLITNVYVSGNVTATASGSIVGGLVGSNSQDATITGSHSNVSVRGGDASQVGAAGFPFSFVSPAPTGAVGGLVGSNIGFVFNSYATGQVSGGANNNIGGLIGFNAGWARQTYATGLVSGGTGSAVGGLVGYNDVFQARIFLQGTTGIFGGEVSQSFASGSVSTGPDGYAGGLVGINDGIICNNCFFPVVVGYIDHSYSISSISGGSNSLIGGLVGWNEGTATESYSTGLISGDSSTVHGGLVGQDNHQTFGGTFSNNYWDIQTSGQTTDGASSGSTGLQTADLKAALPAGFDPSVWTLSSSMNSGYPYLIGNIPPTTPPPPAPSSSSSSSDSSTSTQTQLILDQHQGLAQYTSTNLGGPIVGKKGLSQQPNSAQSTPSTTSFNYSDVASGLANEVLAHWNIPQQASGGILLNLLQSTIADTLAIAIPKGLSQAAQQNAIQEIQDLFETELTRQNFGSLFGTQIRDMGVGAIINLLAEPIAKSLSDSAENYTRAQFPNDPFLANFIGAATYIAILDTATAVTTGEQTKGNYYAVALSVAITDTQVIADASRGLASDIQGFSTSVQNFQRQIDQTIALAEQAKSAGDTTRENALLKAAIDGQTSLDQLLDQHPLLNAMTYLPNVTPQDVLATYKSEGQSFFSSW